MTDRTVGLVAAGALVEADACLSAPGLAVARYFVGRRIRHVTVAPIEGGELLTRDELAALLHDTAVIALHGFLVRTRFWLLPFEAPPAAHLGCGLFGLVGL